MLSNLLTTCGFNSSEQSVLVNLLKRGATTATLLSKATGLKRPTVYAILEGLIARGLVVKQRKKDTTYFAALSPDMISKILTKNAERKFNDFKTSAQLLGPQLSEIALKTDQDFGIFDIRALDSIESVYASLESALGGGEYCSIFNPQMVFKTEAAKKVGMEHTEEALKTHPRVRDIMVDGPSTQWWIKQMSKNPNYQYKLIDEDKKILSDMIFMGGSVYLIHYEPGKEVTIKITQSDYFTSMMTVFEMLWGKLD